MTKGKKPRVEKNERGEENRIRAYFVRLFGKYDFRNEEQFLYFGKWLIFVLLLLVEGLALLQWIDGFASRGGVGMFLLFFAVAAVLAISTALQFFAVRGIKGRLGFYIVDVIAACAFLFFADGLYSLVIYMLVLTQFYFEAKRTGHSILLLVLSILLYITAYGLNMYLVHGAQEWRFLQLLNRTFGFIVAVCAHFLVVQIVLAFYRQYLKLDKALRELSESKKELEKAYAVVAEVTALEERQRIAKEIHDTAGHSLTTVIMQTESAKRIFESNPEEAKTKLVAANLQARHALEELRDGVHLLSGTAENTALKDGLMEIIHESTDGTGIKIRSEIAEVEVPPALRRFLCNSLKEGISNGLRHGGATAFWFELKVEDGQIRFLLSDNGRGVGEEGLQVGFGLRTMEQRAKALGGEARFLSEIEEGFELHIILPYNEGNKNEN